jgi:NADH dehydrogenase FAD-containing subunit
MTELTQRRREAEADAMVLNDLPAASSAAGGQPRAVIVGAGFGGLTAAKALRNAAVRVTVIDRRNYHLFQPLLYQVATAGLSPADIAAPIRSILRDQANAEVVMGRAVGVDRERREVLMEGRASIPYDYLIVAAGARDAYFGHDEWEQFAPGLKKIDDATAIRHAVLVAFERAEAETDPEEQNRLLTFVIIGGGPTGVEMAGAIAELAKKTLAKDFRAIDPASARIVLVEAGPRVLPAFPEGLSRKAQRALEKLGVDVLTNSPVESCDQGGVIVPRQRVAARTVIWAAGVQAAPAAKWLQAEHDKAGRVKVNADLSLPGYPEIFAIGDNAAVFGADGKPVPGVAPAAKQMGAYAARVIVDRLNGRPAPPPFRYRDYGNFATIGRHAAVADFGWLRLSGYLAWLLWGAAHVYFLIGFRSRLAVMLNWLWAYIAFQRGARLITGPGSES